MDQMPDKCKSPVLYQLWLEQKLADKRRELEHARSAYRHGHYAQSERELLLVYGVQLAQEVIALERELSAMQKRNRRLLDNLGEF